MRSAPRAHCGVYWPRATTARGQPLDALPLPGFGAGSPCAQARAVTNGCCWCPLPARATDHTLARVPAAPAPFPTCARCARNRGSDARSQRSTCAKASVGRDGGPPPSSWAECCDEVGGRSGGWSSDAGFSAREQLRAGGGLAFTRRTAAWLHDSTRAAARCTRPWRCTRASASDRRVA